MSRKNEAYIRELLNIPSPSDKEMKCRGFGLDAVRWRRRCIYRTVRLLEAGANAWDISAAALADKTGPGKEITFITAVTWAVIRHPTSLPEQDAFLTKARVYEKSKKAPNYAAEVRCIFDGVKGYGAGKLERLRSELDKQLRKSVGEKKCEAWKTDLEAEIATLKGL